MLYMPNAYLYYSHEKYELCLKDAVLKHVGFIDCWGKVTKVCLQIRQQWYTSI